MHNYLLINMYMVIHKTRKKYKYKKRRTRRRKKYISIGGNLTNHYLLIQKEKEKKNIEKALKSLKDLPKDTEKQKKDLLKKKKEGEKKMIQVNKQLEQLKIIEPILKNIDKDIKNNMKLKDLKKKYIEKKKNTSLLLPYIQNTLSKINKEKIAKLENKSGNLFYRVNITKDGILKFNTAGPLIAPNYDVTNLFTRGKFTSWGGKKKRKRTRKKRKKRKKRRR